jgi:hypothetical protein
LNENDIDELKDSSMSIGKSSSSSVLEGEATGEVFRDTLGDPNGLPMKPPSITGEDENGSMVAVANMLARIVSACPHVVSIQIDLREGRDKV